MGKKEKFQKELDLILEKIRFWRYIVFGIISGAFGILFSLSQNKLQINLLLIIIILLGFLAMIVSIKRISILTKKFYNLLDNLEKG
jgi:sulfite exporter TauE/SafE